MKTQYTVKIDSRWTTKYNNTAVGFSVDMPGFGRVSPCTAYLKQNITTDAVKLPKGFTPDSMLTLISAIDAKLKGININELPIKEWNNRDDSKPANEGLVAAAMVSAASKFNS